MTLELLFACVASVSAWTLVAMLAVRRLMRNILRDIDLQLMLDLAHWFDLQDRKKGGPINDEVQTDIRKWALSVAIAMGDRDDVQMVEEEIKRAANRRSADEGR